MDRINGADTIDIGGGRRGFRDENLVAGAAGTEVTALWLNMTQEEILKVVTEAGIIPSEGDWTQLWQALQVLGLASDARSRRWLTIISMTLSSAPGAPSVGDTYLIPTGATGIWATHVGAIAQWAGTAWSYLTPPDGHGISLPDGRVFERIAGVYVQKIALDAQSGKWNYAVTGGTAAAMTADISPVPASLVDGMSIVVRPSVVPASGCTLNVNSLGARALVWSDGTPFKQGQAAVNVPLRLTYSTLLAGWIITSFKTAVSPWFVLSGVPSPIPSGVNAALINWPNLAAEGVTGTISKASGRFTVSAEDAGTWLFTTGSNTQGETSQEGAILVKNDTVVDLLGMQSSTPLAGHDAQITTVMRVSAGDVIFGGYFQNTGTTQNMGTNGTSKFAGVKLGA